MHLYFELSASEAVNVTERRASESAFCRTAYFNYPLLGGVLKWQKSEMILTNTPEERRPSDVWVEDFPMSIVVSALPSQSRPEIGVSYRYSSMFSFLTCAIAMFQRKSSMARENANEEDPRT